MCARRWADLAVGECFSTNSITISRSDIFEFAADFDPQPYHLDAEAGDNSIFGGLCASGWHVTAVMMRQLTDTFMDQGIYLVGSSSVRHLRWLKPVLADDALTSVISITDKFTAPEAEFDYIECQVEVDNQHGEPVITLSTSLMIGSEDSR